MNVELNIALRGADEQQFVDYVVQEISSAGSQVNQIRFERKVKSFGARASTPYRVVASRDGAKKELYVNINEFSNRKTGEFSESYIEAVERMINFITSPKVTKFFKKYDKKA